MPTSGPSYEQKFGHPYRPRPAADPNPTATAWADAGSPPPGYGRPGQSGTAPGTDQLMPSADPRFSGAQGPAGPQGPPAQLNPTPSLPLGAPGHAVLRGSAGPDGSSDRRSPALISPNNEYVAAFNASMATQRQAIDNALAASLVQLGARRDAAGKVVAGIPQQIKDTYANTDTKMTGVMKAADPGHEGVGGDANAALYANDNLAARQAGESVQPLLQLGVQSNYDRGEAGLNQAHLEGLGNLSAQQAQFNASMAAAEQAHNYQIQDQNNALLHPEADPNQRGTWIQRQQLAASNAETRTANERFAADQTYQHDQAAQSSGFTSYADQQRAESQAAQYSHDNKPSNDEIKAMDINLVLALYNRGVISKKDLDKYKGL